MMMRRSARLASKRLKTKESHVNGPIDNSRISNLSDELLHKILSFLNMGIVVRTSILSKRWRYLWKSTPTLDFHITSQPKSKSKSAHFVDHVLFNRDSRYEIQKFKLKSDHVFLVHDHLHKWIKAATMSTVDELILNIHSFTPCNDIFQLPDQVIESGIKKFSLSSWQKLFKIRTCSYEKILLPKSVCSAEHIKSLRLENVRFPNGDSDNGQLILNCPVLENLIVDNCEISHLKTLTISTPLMKNFEFYKRRYDDDCRKIFCCPKLTSFYWSGSIRKYKEEIFFEDISALTSITLEDVFHDYDIDQGELNLIDHLLKKAKVLTEIVVCFELLDDPSTDMLAKFEQMVLALPTASLNLSISFPSSSSS